MAKAKKTKSDFISTGLVAQNRRANFDYLIEEKFVAGLQLVGTEVKSCRERAIQLNEGYVKISGNQMWLVNVHIAQYGFGNRFNHEVRQQRRLLMHRNEILKLAQWLGTKGGTIIPLKFYLKQGLVKVEIAYCHGKTHGDQRETLRRRQSDLEMRRMVKR